MHIPLNLFPMSRSASAKPGGSVDPRVDRSMVTQLLHQGTAVGTEKKKNDTKLTREDLMLELTSQVTDKLAANLLIQRTWVNLRYLLEDIAHMHTQHVNRI